MPDFARRFSSPCNGPALRSCSFSTPVASDIRNGRGGKRS